jgi:hypothetical protein
VAVTAPIALALPNAVAHSPTFKEATVAVPTLWYLVVPPTTTAIVVAAGLVVDVAVVDVAVVDVAVVDLDVAAPELRWKLLRKPLTSMVVPDTDFTVPVTVRTSASRAGKEPRLPVGRVKVPARPDRSEP